MIEQLLALIREYQMRINEAVSLFREHHALDNPINWRQAGLPREGYLDPEKSIPYFFHGVGCWVGLPSGALDWDFGHDGRVSGLNRWFLWCFAKEGTKNFPAFADQEKLDAAFNEAISAGIIIRPYRHLQDDLYYLEK